MHRRTDLLTEKSPIWRANDGVQMRIFGPIAGIFGLALLTGLIAYFGFASVLQAALSSEWGTALVVLARAAALAGCGIGWWFLLTPNGPGPHVFIGLRFIREAINALFPFAVVGGDIIGARLLTHFGPAMSLAIASVLIDIFVQVVSLLIYVGAESLSSSTFPARINSAR